MRRNVKQCLKCGKKFTPTTSIGKLYCPHCGAEVATRYTYNAPKDDYAPYPNKTPLRPGMKAMWQGKEFTLIGRAVYSMIEEGVAYYWDEFLLAAEDGTVLYLEYDEGKFIMMEPFEPARPLTPISAGQLSVGSSVELDGVNGRVTEMDRATLRYAQGSLSYSADIDDAYYYADVRYITRPYALAWDDEGVEYLRGTYLSKKEVFALFGLQDQIAALNVADRRERQMRNFGGCCFVLSLLGFFAWMLFLGSGRVIATQTFSANPQTRYEQRFGPFQINGQGRVHRLVLHSQVPAGEAWAAAVLENAQGRELFGVQGDFWDMSGSDSEGPWHERVTLATHTDFRIANPGSYFVRVFSEGPAAATASPYAATNTVSGVGATFTPAPPVTGGFGEITGHFEIQNEVMHPGPMLFYALCMFLVSIVCFFLGSRAALAEAAANAAQSS